MHFHKNVGWFNFHWSLFSLTHLAISQHEFICGGSKVICYYLDQWWPRYLTSYGVTWLQLVNSNRELPMCNRHINLAYRNHLCCSMSLCIAQCMIMSSNGNIFRATGTLCGNSPITGEFPSQRPVTRSFDVCFLSAPENGRVSNRDASDFKTTSRPLWRHCNGFWCMQNRGACNKNV